MWFLLLCQLIIIVKFFNKSCLAQLADGKLSHVTNVHVAYTVKINSACSTMIKTNVKNKKKKKHYVLKETTMTLLFRR